MSAAEDFALGAAALPTLDRAAQALGITDPLWFRDEGLTAVVEIRGHPVERVVWRRVLEYFERAADEPPARDLAPVVELGQPLTTWRAIAAACGVSGDTLARRRKERGDDSPAFFVDADAARVWYRELLREPDKVPARRGRKATGAATGMTLAELRKRKVK